MYIIQEEYEGWTYVFLLPVSGDRGIITIWYSERYGFDRFGDTREEIAEYALSYKLSLKKLCI